MTRKPITITIREEQDKKIRQLQANLISFTSSNWSYSKIISIILEEGFKTMTVSKAKKMV